MDQFLLHAVASEAAGRLVEREVLRVSHLGAWRYLLRFATPGRDALLISARPDLPRLHLTEGGLRSPEEPSDRFASLLDREISGGVLTALLKRPWDRVVEMSFRLPRRDDRAGARRLVVELLGRSSNLVLLDEAGTILAHCRELASAFRAPMEGRPYTLPPGREGYADIPTGPEALPMVRERFADPAAFLDPLSPLLARDLRAIRQAGRGGPGAASAPPAAWGEAVERRLHQILEATRTGRWAPVVYSRRPLSEMILGDSLSRDDLIVSALPLLSLADSRGCASPMESRPFASPSEAAEAGLGLLERLRDFQALKEHQAAIIHREIRRLTTLIAKLRAEVDRALQADLFRKEGEAILSGLAAARVDGTFARVPDPYAPEPAEIAIPIDPSLSLQDNAQALFDRYKKRKRGLPTIETRLAAATARLREWESLVDVAESVRGPADVERLREAIAQLGIVHAPRRPRAGAPAPAREGTARVRRHISPDGLLILVGRSGEENEALTFRVASPWDFWLHAAETPGAHVVVRNPKRLKTIPEATLRRAAEIAAFYSGARGAGKVEVHYTQRKHVRKRKGMPSGQVLLRKFRSIRVVPRLPGGTLADV